MAKSDSVFFTVTPPIVEKFIPAIALSGHDSDTIAVSSLVYFKKRKY
jgi:hypothetical protein